MSGGLLHLRPLPGAPLFNGASAAFLRQTLFFDLARWARRHPAFGNMQGPLQEMLEALDHLGAVTMLAAGGLSTEVQDAAGIDVGLELGENPRPLSLRQACGIRHVKGQLDLRGGSIDVLPPRAPTATELEMQLGERDFKRFRAYPETELANTPHVFDNGRTPDG
jgi:hypothetical protein